MIKIDKKMHFESFKCVQTIHFEYTNLVIFEHFEPILHKMSRFVHFYLQCAVFTAVLLVKMSRFAYFDV